MLLLPRLVFALAFWGAALVVPGWMIARALWPGGRDGARVAAGMMIVLAVALAFSLVTDLRLSRWSIAGAGMLCALVSSMRWRGRLRR